MCPVRPEHTSWYVGFGVVPPAYPTAVVNTPSASQNFRSAPQKQPIPTISCWNPSGNGGSSGVPSTKCSSGTGISSSRPGSASSGAMTLVCFVNRPMGVTSRVVPVLRTPRQHRDGLGVPVFAA